MKFIVQQEKFEGPLELLLELIEKEKLAVSEISLAEVTDEYLRFVKTLGAIDPEQLASFLVVAAQLLLIKSRSLLPQLRLSAEDQQSIEELEERLTEYKKIRERAHRLKELAHAGLSIITRQAYQELPVIFYPPAGLTMDLIRETFAAFCAALPKLEKLAEEKLKRIISLEEKVAHIRLFLQDTIERAFSELTKNAKEKVDVIVSFLALLELAKQKFVDLKQQKLFEDIVIKKL